MKTVTIIKENNARVIFRAEKVDDLMQIVYEAGKDGTQISITEAVIVTDIIEVKEGEEKPGFFSYTENIIPSSGKDWDLTIRL